MSQFMRRLMVRHWANTKLRDDARLAALRAPKNVVQSCNHPYLSDGDALHQVDVYWPKGAEGPLPTVVDIHGGGWMYGDKELNKPYCLHLAAQGFAVVNMSYRLLPNTDLKGQVQDIFACLHWLVQNGPALHCDPQRLFLTGDSAGGHLAGLCTCIQLDPELQRVYEVAPANLIIRAMALSHSVCNLRGRLSGLPLADREMHRMWFGRQPERCIHAGKASFHDTAGTLSLPPVMLISSENDWLHPQSLGLANYLKQTGARHQTLFWPKTAGRQLGHVFHIKNPHWLQSRETSRRMLSFFIQALPESA